jgi:ribosomal protein L37E
VAELVCPRCGAPGAVHERFCANCGMPLVDATRAEAEPTPAQARARKIKKQYAEGALVQVAGARHLPEAELIQGLLLEEGVPSILRRTRGFDVPEMLAAGPRDVLVPESGVAVARDALLKQGMLADSYGPPAVRPVGVLAGLLVAVAVVALVILLGVELTS